MVNKLQHKHINHLRPSYISTYLTFYYEYIPKPNKGTNAEEQFIGSKGGKATKRKRKEK